jgi:hypothetical protein
VRLLNAQILKPKTKHMSKYSAWDRKSDFDEIYVKLKEKENLLGVKLDWKKIKRTSLLTLLVLEQSLNKRLKQKVYETETV